MFEHYFRVEVIGVQHLPPGPSLLVSNHGGFIPWDGAMIQRFMFGLGPISSLYDFLTFGVMLWIFHAHASLFRSGWFVESLSTQALVIFVIRTRRVPFFHSPPGRVLAFASVAAVVIGAILPVTPAAALFGFRPLPPLSAQNQERVRVGGREVRGKLAVIRVLVALVVLDLLVGALGGPRAHRPPRRRSATRPARFSHAR